MDQQFNSSVVKQKVISSSKLQPITVKQSSRLSQTDVASLESDIASISFFRNKLAIPVNLDTSDDLSISQHHFSRSLGKIAYSVPFFVFFI